MSFRVNADYVSSKFPFEIVAMTMSLRPHVGGDREVITNGIVRDLVSISNTIVEESEKAKSQGIRSCTINLSSFTSLLFTSYVYIQTEDTLRKICKGANITVEPSPSYQALLKDRDAALQKIVTASW